MLLSLHIGFSFIRAAVTCAILERISGFETSFKTLLRALYTLTLISLLMPLVLFVISLVYSEHIAILYLVQVLQRLSTRASSSCSSSARGSMSSSNRRLVIVLPPILSFNYVIPEHHTQSFGEKILKRMGERRHSHLTPTIAVNHSLCRHSS